MKKIIVIGCPGSGKSCFSRALHEKIGIPLVHLDMLFWNPDKTTVEKGVFLERLASVLKKDEWIIDGNYKRTIEIRLKECDTVFLFDLPTEICLQGVTQRIGKERYDLPWLETELDPEFAQFIEDFPKTTLLRIYDLLEKYKDEKQVVIFKTRAEADAFLESLTE